MKDDNLVITKTDKNINNYFSNNITSDKEIFKNCFNSDKENDFSSSIKLSEEPTDLLENDINLSNTSGNAIVEGDSQLFFSTPIPKTLNSSKKQCKKVNKIKKSPIKITIDDDDDTLPTNDNILKNENEFLLSPPSQPGFKIVKKPPIDVDALDLNIDDEILNSSQNTTPKSKKTQPNKKTNCTTSPKENINISNFKVDSNKFEKYSIFSIENQLNSSFERIKNLNALLNKEIEKKKSGCDNGNVKKTEIDDHKQPSPLKKDKSRTCKNGKTIKSLGNEDSRLNDDLKTSEDIICVTSDKNIELNTHDENSISSSPLSGKAYQKEKLDDSPRSSQQPSFLNDNILDALDILNRSTTDHFSLTNTGTDGITGTNDISSSPLLNSELTNIDENVDEKDDASSLISSQVTTVDEGQTQQSKETKPKKRKRNVNNANRQQKELEKERKKKIQEELKLEKKRHRELQKQLKKLEKEEKLLKRKEQLKNEKLNKLKTKLEACKEMIVCLDDGFHMSKDLEYAENILMSPSQVAENEEEDSTTHSTQEQNKVEEKVPSGEMLEQKLNSLNVEVEYKDYPVANTITWKRKINYIYDENLNIYRGTKKDYVVHEEYVLLRISALEFASKANSLEEVEAFYNEFKKKFQYRLKNTPLEDKLLRLSSNPWNGLKKKRWIFLIEGLNDYYRKRSTLENRKMREIMKSQLTPNRPKRHRKETINEEEMPIDPRSFCGVDMGKYFKLKGSLSNYPSPQVLEEAFLWLQMTGECLVIFSSGWDKTVEWICTFTKEISITPFKEKIEQSNNYCTYNKIKTEADYSKIWYRMLEEVYRISPTIIERIIKEYPTVFSLYEKYQQVDEKTGEALLEDLEVVSSTGNVRKIGKSISKRIYTWFTEEDGNKKAI